jgi:bacterioferritin-associated ferredoxin
MKDRMVCDCYGIKVSDIERYIESGLDSFEKIQDKTRIGVLCSACINDAKNVIDSIKEGNVHK